MAINTFEGDGPKKWGAKRLQEWIELQSNKEMMFFTYKKDKFWKSIFLTFVHDCCTRSIL